MTVQGFVTNIRQKKSVGLNGQEYVNRFLEIEGLNLSLPSKLPVPDTGKEIRASINVQWHKADPDAERKAWVSFQCNGWSYV